jgi:hypothetical protein
VNRDQQKDKSGQRDAEVPRGEDYGGPADYPDDATKYDTEGGKYSGGTTGTRQGNSEGEKFGEFDHTGTGVDLTEEMENTDARSGLVKGGEHKADDVAGPAQYGGDAGGLNKGKQK